MRAYVLAGLLGVTLLTGAPPARAAGPDPGLLRPAPAGTTRLLGLTGDGAVVMRAAPAGESSRDGVLPGPALFTGALGGTLPRRPVPEQLGPEDTTLPVTGKTLPWYRERVTDRATVADLHRLDLVTGQDVLDGTVPAIGHARFNGTAWIVAPASGSTVEFYPAATAPGRADARWPGRRSILTVPGGTIGSLDADGTGALVIALVPDRDDYQETKQVLLLVDLATGATKRLFETGTLVGVGTAMLAPGTAAWTETSGNFGYVVGRVPRAGGEVKRYYEKEIHPGSPRYRPQPRLLDDGRVAYFVDQDRPDTMGYTTALRVIDLDGTTHDHAVPDDVNGLEASSGSVYTATTDGVFRIDATTGASNPGTRVAELPTPYRALHGWSFQNGELTWADHGGQDPDGLSLWRYDVESGAAKRLPFQTGAAPGTVATPGFVVAGDLAVVGSKTVPGRWVLVGKGRPTGVRLSPEPLKGLDLSGARPRLSGDRVLIGGQVFGRDGKLILTEPPQARRTGRDALDGDRLVYGVTSGRFGVVRLVDLTKPGSWSGIVSQRCDHAPEVAVHGSRVAWASCDRGTITVEDQDTGETSVHPTGFVGGRLQIVLEDARVGWVAGETASVVGSSGSGPVTLVGPTRAMAIAGDTIVREVPRDDPAAPATLQVEAFRQ